MERKIKVSARAVAAALQFVSKEETRYYLCGVQIEPAPAGGVLCIGTDGHTMGIAHDPAGSCNRESGWICPIDDALLAHLQAKVGEKWDDDGEFAVDYLKPVDRQHMLYFEGSAQYLYERETERPDVLQVGCIAAAYAPAIDGRFPPWRNILPKSRNQATAVNFNPLLLAKFARAMRCLTTTSFPHLQLLPSVERGAVVVMSDQTPEFFGMLMPVFNGSLPTLTWLDGFDFVGWLQGTAAGANGQAASENARPHKWVRSTLGHGESMCEHCKITNREAAVLGKLNECPAVAAGANAQSAGEDPQAAPAA